MLKKEGNELIIISARGGMIEEMKDVALEKFEEENLTFNKYYWKQMCDTVARSLYAAGYEVDTCYDGAEALECILAENYDLIVLDLNLPGMDGMDLLKELRKENEETKVLILSARGQIADKVEGVLFGVHYFQQERKVSR